MTDRRQLMDWALTLEEAQKVEAIQAIAPLSDDACSTFLLVPEAERLDMLMRTVAGVCMA